MAFLEYYIGSSGPYLIDENDPRIALPNQVAQLKDLPTNRIPSDTVVSEEIAGQSANAGTALTYSRGDHTHGTPASSAGASITQIEVDFGTTPADEHVFTISDAAVVATSRIIASIAYEATADNDADEVDMSRVSCSAGQPMVGSFSLVVFASDGPVSGKFKVNYSFA